MMTLPTYRDPFYSGCGCGNNAYPSTLPASASGPHAASVSPPIVLGEGVTSVLKLDGFGNHYLEVTSDLVTSPELAAIASFTVLTTAAAAGDAAAVAAIAGLAPYI